LQEKSLEMQSIGELHVKVKYAKELPAADFGGKSDPYLCLALGLSSKSVTFKMMQKTRVIKKTVNPEWNEEIVLKVYDRKLQVSPAVSHVWLNSVTPATQQHHAVL
jgi:Ca2+-dependent lipid-binding protein